MRPIDADALFDSAFKVWGTEADGGETNLFMEMINDAPTISPPPNDPLTLEQLREMDGEPVWVCDPDGSMGMFALVDVRNMVCRTPRGGWAIFENFGQAWLAYRRKPEEESR